MGRRLSFVNSRGAARHGGRGPVRAKARRNRENSLRQAR
jgi:hypothetical protein